MVKECSWGGCYYDIYPQHLHYYTIVSLSRLASEAGFEVVFVRESGNKDYLEMLVRKAKSVYSYNFNERLGFDREKLKKIVNNYKNVSLWGASYIARSCVEFIDPVKVKHFYDVSDVKIGKYIADFPVMIERPTEGSVKENDIIIIMANEYTQDVLKTLKDFDFKGDIIGFDSDGFITKLKI